tara:strand:+ start:241 stop:507 length:267 start_codon:yes stop_codon:yes gene_type:complete
LLEKYKTEILPNPRVELIHASYDDEEADALKWARQARFPWPTVLYRDWEAVGLEKYGAFAGDIYLVDSAGQLIAKTEKEAFAKISSLK